MSESRPNVRVREEFACNKLSFQQPNPVWLATSPFLPDWLLLGIRVVIALFSVSIIIYSGVGEDGPKWFIYLTNWGFFTLTLAALGFLALSVEQIVQRSPEQGSASHEWRWYHSVQQMMFTLSLTVSITVTLLAWTLLEPSTSFLAIAVHALNAVMTLVELAVSNFKINLLHAVYSVIYGVVYLIFTGIYATAGGKNSAGDSAIYPVLDWKDKPGKAAALAIPIALFVIPAIHALVYALCKLRMYIANRNAHNAAVPAFRVPVSSYQEVPV